MIFWHKLSQFHSRMIQHDELDAFETELDPRYYLTVATALNSDVNFSRTWDLGVPQITQRVQGFTLEGLNLSAVVFQSEHRAPLDKLFYRLQQESLGGSTICFMFLTQSFPIFERAAEKKLPEEVWNMRCVLSQWDSMERPYLKKDGVTLFDAINGSKYFSLSQVSPLVVEGDGDMTDWALLDDIAKETETMGLQWSHPPSPISEMCTQSDVSEMTSPIQFVDHLLDVRSPPPVFSPIQHQRNVHVQEPIESQQPVDRIQHFQKHFKGRGAIGVAMHDAGMRDQLRFKRGDTILIRDKSGEFNWVGEVLQKESLGCFTKCKVHIVWE